jgi:hypothetical protein
MRGDSAGSSFHSRRFLSRYTNRLLTAAVGASQRGEALTRPGQRPDVFTLFLVADRAATGGGLRRSAVRPSPAFQRGCACLRRFALLGPDHSTEKKRLLMPQCHGEFEAFDADSLAWTIENRRSHQTTIPFRQDR